MKRITGRQTSWDTVCFLSHKVQISLKCDRETFRLHSAYYIQLFIYAVQWH